MKTMRWAMANLRRTGDSAKGSQATPVAGRAASPGGRAMKLVVKEAYRMVRVKEGDRVRSIPALAAVVRSLIALAAKGNGPAQRLVFPLVEQAEQTCAVQPTARDPSKLDKLSERDIARRVALILAGAVPRKPAV